MITSENLFYGDFKISKSEELRFNRNHNQRFMYHKSDFMTIVITQVINPDF